MLLQKNKYEKKRFTRSEFLVDGGGVMGDLTRFSMVGGGGGGGRTFLGIFFKLLIEAVLFELDVFVIGEDSRLIFT